VKRRKTREHFITAVLSEPRLFGIGSEDELKAMGGVLEQGHRMVGIPAVWSVERWISENPWESEDRPSKKDICARDSYCDHRIAWLDDRRVAVGGIGDDDIEIIDGARIFDATSLGTGRWGDELRWALEITAFPGPAGRFFSDGISLFSSAETALSRWDPENGSRTGHLEDFRPTHYHGPLASSCN
jgi:hypothetical protein